MNTLTTGTAKVGRLLLGKATDPAAIIGGAGTAASPKTAALAASKNFLGFWLKSTGAGAYDVRGMYMRLYLAGAGQSGEAIRAFTTINGVAAAQAHGIHATASIDATGSVTGQAVGLRATISAAAAVRVLGGNLQALRLDSDIGAGNTLPVSSGFMYLTDAGAVKLDKFLVAEGVDATTMFKARTASASSHTLKVRINGVDYWVLLSDQQ